jgi:mono/diheme cytochrome c family protein
MTKLIVLALVLVVLSGATGGMIALAQAPSQEELEEGALIYTQNCSMCHGPQGEGRIGATLSKDWPSIRPDLRVKDTITNGIPGSVMPAWSEDKGGPLSSEQIDLLTNYILSWQTGGAIIVTSPTPVVLVPLTEVPGVIGDPTNGANLFVENCAVCHGPQGQGRIGATLAKDWPSFRPDLQVKETIVSGIQGSVMPAWSTSKGGPLDDGQINDITAYIMTWESTGAALTPAVTATEEPTNTWLSGAGGVIVLALLFVIIVAVVLAVQRKRV